MQIHPNRIQAKLLKSLIDMYLCSSDIRLCINYRFHLEELLRIKSEELQSQLSKLREELLSEMKRNKHV